MAKSKKVFISKEIEDVFKNEEKYFVIRIGNDFYNKNGSHAFTLSQAEKHYNFLLNSILHSIKNGNKKQKDAALRCLLNFQIIQLKIH